MAPQYRRGGKHAVKDEDLTHTKYDDYSREQLLAAVKEAGCYVKDDKKSVMARKLANHERNRQSAERRAMQERKGNEEKKQQEIKDAAKASKNRRRARAKRNEDRGKRREHGEDVSSNSDDTDDADEQDRSDAHKLTVTGGEALSDETWEDTCSETTVHSVNSRVASGCKLRLFEWPYTTMPSPHPPPDFRFELFPTPLTYTPLKLITTHTHEKVTLPGQKYPAGVDPDFVPILDSLTRSAARHGHMIGLLAHATIERATAWQGRTIVQGWNGRMYLSLPSPSPNASRNLALDATYRKWRVEKHKLLRPTPGITDPKTDRKRRLAQQTVNKRKATAEVYEASEWRPLAVSYMPAYLDWDQGTDCTSLQDHVQTTESLFYIRFPGCDLPHYYFWVREGEWSDPTTADPIWSPSMVERQEHKQTVVEACTTAKYRVKKLTTPPSGLNSTPASSDFEPTLLSIEYDLITYGLAPTLTKNRALAISSGKGEAWNVFTRKLPVLYPSGDLPCVPPAEGVGDQCVAEKIEAVLAGDVAVPFTGQESWIRNDDDFWDVVTHASDEEVGLSPLDVFEDSQRQSCSSTRNDRDASAVEALYRRDSIDTPIPPRHQHIWTWLTTISPAYSPHIDPLSPTPTSSHPELEEPISPLDLNRSNTPSTCPFCSTPWTALPDFEKAGHMLSHSHTQLQHTTTAAWRVDAIGVGVKRRHSLLSVETLRSYHVHCGKGRRLLRIDSAKAMAQGWARLWREDSPFTREVRRIEQGRGSAGWRGGS